MLDTYMYIHRSQRHCLTSVRLAQAHTNYTETPGPISQLEISWLPSTEQNTDLIPNNKIKLHTCMQKVCCQSMFHTFSILLATN